MRTFVEHQRAVRELLAPLLASLEAAEGAEALSPARGLGPPRPGARSWAGARP